MNANILTILTLLVTTNAQLNPWTCLLSQLNQLFSRLYSLDTSKPSRPNSSSESGRIVGGTVANISEVPYQLALGGVNRADCGASIISEFWALTVAHCVRRSYHFKYLEIRSGSDVILSGEVHKIVDVVIHEDYSLQLRRNDIAVAKVNPAFSFIRGRREPIQLIPAGTEIPEGTLGIVSGWGILKENTFNLPKFLQKAYVPILSREACEQSLPSIDQGDICAGYWEGGVDSCQGDSGGPLAVNNQLVGVVAWGYGCARPGLPGAYSSVAYHRDWIRQHTGV